MLAGGDTTDLVVTNGCQRLRMKAGKESRLLDLVSPVSLECRSPSDVQATVCSSGAIAWKEDGKQRFADTGDRNRGAHGLIGWFKPFRQPRRFTANARHLLQAGGRWFEPGTAHLRKPLLMAPFSRRRHGTRGVFPLCGEPGRKSACSRPPYFPRTRGGDEYEERSSQGSATYRRAPRTRRQRVARGDQQRAL